MIRSLTDLIQDGQTGETPILSLYVGDSHQGDGRIGEIVQVRRIQEIGQFPA
jgi:hypothetical protein